MWCILSRINPWLLSPAWRQAERVWRRRWVLGHGEGVREENGVHQLWGASSERVRGHYILMIIVISHTCFHAVIYLISVLFQRCTWGVLNLEKATGEPTFDHPDGNFAMLDADKSRAALAKKVAAEPPQQQSKFAQVPFAYGVEISNAWSIPDEWISTSSQQPLSCSNSSFNPHLCFLNFCIYINAHIHLSDSRSSQKVYGVSDFQDGQVASFDSGAWNQVWWSSSTDVHAPTAHAVHMIAKMHRCTDLETACFAPVSSPRCITSLRTQVQKVDAAYDVCNTAYCKGEAEGFFTEAFHPYQTDRPCFI